MKFPYYVLLLLLQSMQGESRAREGFYHGTSVSPDNRHSTNV